jgi:transcriptional regulator of heat shock response
MDPRTASILTSAIREFIETGEPVSSGELYSKYKFRVKPATIRHELAELDEAGFLVQPHTSSGRVPSDKGYAFFVDVILKDLEALTGARRRNQGNQTGAMRQEFSPGTFDNFIEEVSDALNLLSVGYETHERMIYKSGLEELVEGLVKEGELSSIGEVTEIIKDFEAMDAYFGELLRALPNSRVPKVFIGKSPITRSPHLSVIADVFHDGDGRNFIVAAVGSKRMDYESNLRFFKNLKHTMQSYE